MESYYRNLKSFFNLSLSDSQRFLTSKHIPIPNPCYYFAYVLIRVRDYQLKIYMFWTLKRNPLIEEIDKFCNSRKRFQTTENHRYYLHKFVKIMGIISVEEINERLISDFCEVLGKETTEYQKLSARAAIRLFVTKARENMTLKTKMIGRPPKEARNREMLKLRRSDRVRWTIQALANKYGIGKRAVWEILNRYENME